jgi:simple sugar transport system permease protein
MGKSIFARIEALPIVLIALAMLGTFMVTAPNTFLGPLIYTTFLSSAPPLIFLAMGLTFVIGAGEIDLSFPAIISFAGAVFAILFKQYELGWLAVIAGLATGLFVGLLNGLLVSIVGIPSFIATLGTFFLFTGLATVISGGKSYALRGAEESTVWQVLVGRFSFGGEAFLWYNQFSVQFFWVAALVVLLWFILNRHRFGEHVLFLGDSNDVSRVLGIRVYREKLKLFLLMGFLAACAAILLTLENKNYFGNQGQGYLLLAIAAVLIGGTSIFGGKATIVGTFSGCVIMWFLEAGLVASGLTGEWVRVAQGAVLLTAIIVYILIEEPQRRAAALMRLGLWRRDLRAPQAIPETGQSSPRNAGSGKTGGDR